LASRNSITGFDFCYPLFKNNKEFNMNIGMLWFDNDPRTALTAKVSKAADYYRQKYGLVADICMVHPSMLNENRSSKEEVHAGKVIVRTNRAILPGHLWIGTEDKNQ
jgi:hypothetical protein